MPTYYTTNVRNNCAPIYHGQESCIILYIFNSNSSKLWINRESISVIVIYNGQVYCLVFLINSARKTQIMHTHFQYFKTDCAQFKLYILQKNCSPSFAAYQSISVPANNHVTKSKT